MKTDLNEQLDKLKLKYDCKVQDKSVWEGKPVNDFFSEKREVISELLKEYPKFKYKDVQMLAGLTDGEMPFEKELIQAKIYSVITSEETVLLPRYLHRVLNEIFKINLKQGSLADGIVFLPREEEYIEFKFCQKSKIGSYVNNTSNADVLFFVLENMNYPQKSIFEKDMYRAAKHWKGWNGETIILCDLEGDGCWRIKKEAISSPPNSPRATTELPSSGPRIDEIISPTVPIVYLNELKTVNRNIPIHYPEYYIEESKYFNVEKLERYFLYGGRLTDTFCFEEYKIISNQFAKIGIRTINPKNIVGPEENRLWLKLATAVVEFKSSTGTKLCPISAEEFARELGVRRIRIEDLIPGFTLIKEKNSIEKMTDSESINRKNNVKKRRK